METVDLTSIPVAQLDKLQETLDELKRMETKNLRMNRIKMVCVLVVAIVFLVVGTFVLINVQRVVRETESVAETVKEATVNINSVAKELNEIDYAELGKKLQSIVGMAEESMKVVSSSAGNLDQLITDSKTTMERLKSLDIEGLNAGIKRMNDVLKPLAEFFNIF